MSDRGRGQLIVVAGLGLALALVMLALILNSAIYTENIASRNIDSGASDAIDVRHDVEEGLGGLMDSVNDRSTGESYSTLETNYTDGTGEWGILASHHDALQGKSVRTNVATNGAGDPIINRGVRVADENRSTAFTPRSGTLNDWTVAPDVRARSLRLVVTDVSASPSDSTVESALDSSNAWNTTGSFFFVDIDDGEWRMAVYGDGSGNVKVGVYDGNSDSYTVCSNTPASTPVRIDVGRGTVNNVPCEALSSLGKQTGPYDVHYANADGVTGTYELTADRVVDGPADDTGAFTDVVDRRNYGRHCDGPTYYGFGGGNPYVAPALYSSETDLHFRSQSVSYYSTVRVAADELSEGATSPQIRSIDVDDESSSSIDTKFNVTADVADPDGDLSEVTIMINRTSGSYNDSKSGSVTGRTGTVTKTFNADVNLNNNFDITVTVRDGATNERSVTQRHEADGDGVGCPP